MVRLQVPLPPGTQLVRFVLRHRPAHPPLTKTLFELKGSIDIPSIAVPRWMLYCGAVYVPGFDIHGAAETSKIVLKDRLVSLLVICHDLLHVAPPSTLLHTVPSGQ